MAMSLREQLRAQRDATEKWIRERQDQVDHGVRELEDLGRAEYGKAIRSGRQVAARTTSELRQLGAQSVARRPVERPADPSASGVRAAAPSKGTPSKPNTNSDRAVREQLRAAASGFADELSFGQADRIGALAGATKDIVTGQAHGFGDDYRRRMVASDRQDKFDAEHYGLARGVGQGVGFATSLVGPGGLGVGARLATKLVPGALRAIEAANATARIAELAPKGLTAAAVGGGAASGVLGQAIHDAASGRLGTASDYVGSAVGGAAGGLAARAHLPGAGRVQEAVNRAVPRIAGGIDAATSAAAEDALEGRDISLRDIAEAARGGVVGARAGEIVGKYGAAALPWKTKGDLGEFLSSGKSWLEGEGWPTKGPVTPEVAANFPRTVGTGPQRRVYVPSGRYVVADQVRPSGVAIEAKFGSGAELARAQPEALAVFGPSGLYRVDHWLESDIGRAGSLLVAGLAAPWTAYPD